MKIRNGFISNSSSSSFVIIGIKLKKEDIEKMFPDSEDAFDDFFNTTTFDTVFDDESCSYYIGKTLSDCEEYCEEFEYNLSLLENLKIELTGLFEITGKTEKDIAIFGGVRES